MPAMAVVLGRNCNAAEYGFRPRSAGLPGSSRLGAAFVRHADSMPSQRHLDPVLPESRSAVELIQSFPR